MSKEMQKYKKTLDTVSSRVLKTYLDSAMFIWIVKIIFSINISIPNLKIGNKKDK